MEPWWKRRIEGDIKRIRREVNILEREKRGEIKSKRKVKELENKYNIKKKGLTLVIEERKQKLLAKSAKIKRYEQRITQYRQNRLFETDQKKVYEELNGEFNGESVIPDSEESKSFWSGILGVEKEHNQTADCMLHDNNECCACTM